MSSPLSREQFLSNSGGIPAEALVTALYGEWLVYNVGRLESAAFKSLLFPYPLNNFFQTAELFQRTGSISPGAYVIYTRRIVGFF